MEMQLSPKLDPLLPGLLLPLDQPGKAGSHLRPWALGEMEPPVAGVPWFSKSQERRFKGPEKPSAFFPFLI